MSKKQYGVIGWPLAQSLSPLLHNKGFQGLALDGEYFRWEIAPEQLGNFMTSVRSQSIAGVSVTIPHKRAVIPFLDGITDRARSVGAVNTLFWKEGALWGDNTDVLGFMQPLEERPLERSRPILILGAGGAARAAIAGLVQAGFQNIMVATPSNTSHLPLAEVFSIQPITWEKRHTVPAALVVNTTPVGMRGKHEGESPYCFDNAPAEQGMCIAYDIVYNPLKTRFLQEAEERQWETISGIEMFWGQGDAQFLCWTGQHLPCVARIALEQALQA